MGFRLVPKSMTLNDLERRNSRIVCVISPNSVLLGPITQKWLKTDLKVLSPIVSVVSPVVFHFWP